MKLFEKIIREAYRKGEEVREIALSREESWASANWLAQKARERFIHEKLYEAEMDERAYLFGEAEEEARDRILWHEE